MGCLMCGRGMHAYCKQGTIQICCCAIPAAQDITADNLSDDTNNIVDMLKEESDEDWRKTSKRRRRGIGKRDESLRDQQSTGRKRAAVKYPLDREAACEWRQLLFAGGGEAPIVGCVDGRQQARHHGPDKNTLNNDEGNVHRICHACHNRWHARNDETYKWGGIYRPHDPNTQASPKEIYDAEVSWIGKRLKKVSD